MAQQKKKAMILYFNKRRHDSQEGKKLNVYGFKTVFNRRFIYYYNEKSIS